MKHTIAILGITTLILGAAPTVHAQTTNTLSTQSKGNIYQQASDKLKSGDYAGAIEAYNQVLLFDANDSDAYVNRGIARFQLGDKRGALQDFNQALSLNPTNAEAYTQRGGVYLTMGEKRKAKADFQKAAKIRRSQSSVNDQQAPNPNAPPQQ